MGVEKKPYGLIYSTDTNGNPDGRLCVTLRNDDKPFEGVTSFAVEEGTENLVPSPLDPANTGWSLSTNGTSTVDYSGDEIIITCDQSDGVYTYLRKGVNISGNAGDTLAWSVDLKSDAPGYVALRLGSAGVSEEYHWFYIDGMWRRYFWTHTLEGDYTSFFVDIMAGKAYDAGNYTPPAKIYARRPQLEQKPFATSFVDGSRTNGSLLLFDDATVRSWVDNGIVIAGWWKFNYWSDDKHFRVFSCTESGGFNIEKFPNYDIRLAINDGGTYLQGYFQDPDVFADLDWHFVVFYYRPDTKVAEVYVDAVEQTSVTLSQGLYFNEDKYYSLAIGAELNGGTNPPTVGSQASILVANLFIGKPLDKAGHLIWSDPYIQQLYQAKRPFSVPPKMPVI